MRIPELPHGFYFHVGRNHAYAEYGGYNGPTKYGVQIRYRKVWPFYSVVHRERCKPHPVDVGHTMIASAQWLASMLHEKAKKDILEGSYRGRELPDADGWNKALRKPDWTKALER